MPRSRFQSTMLRLQIAQEHGKSAWWRRDHFLDEEYSSHTPAWHLFDGTEEAPLGGIILRAPCGYRLSFARALKQIPRTAISNPPRVAERCSVCQKQLRG